MEPKWAEENLQTIRTLMERSAVYRRALAPIMTLAGTVGLTAMLLGLGLKVNESRSFCLLWLGAAIVAVIGSFLIARRQAIRDQEVFWSPPTRRVALALLPPLLAGCCLGGSPVFIAADSEFKVFSSLIWIFCYGGALHSAGFFMPRGIRLFGWVFMALGCLIFFSSMSLKLHLDFNANWLMGFSFGVLHLAYGIYLYLTENKKLVA